MLTLAYPWLLLLLPAPLLVMLLTPPHREKRQGLIVPFLERIAQQTGQRPSAGGVVLRAGLLRALFLISAWVLLVVTVACPQWIEPPVSKNVPTRDLLLAVDLSGSMEAQDFTNAKGQKVDRLTAIKGVLDDFLLRQKGARVGLIFFGTAAFVQAPFTEDTDVCRDLLDEAQVGMAGPQTAFGDAIGLAITLLDRSTIKQRSLIILTDGNDTTSKVLPVAAARIAHDKGIVIYTVAVGDPKTVGEQALDIDTLKTVATVTGGIYSYAADRTQLENTYRHLDELQTHETQTIQKHPRLDVYYWPLGAALLLTFLQHALLLFRSSPRTGQAHVAIQSNFLVPTK